MFDEALNLLNKVGQSQDKEISTRKEKLIKEVTKHLKLQGNNIAVSSHIIDGNRQRFIIENPVIGYRMREKFFL
ncbi:34088_t:CDS:2 [Racocetra persica]|uniref:34088_t:CDS:1 n=1 Tax=Racocetra persica TaxID=160502 RepID=A0ACA9L942_9GLOM|nr:34088_t:CDS:2 [Racocetra persica]